MLRQTKHYGSNPLISVIFILVSILIIELFAKYFVIGILRSSNLVFYLLIKILLLAPMLYFFVCKRISHYIRQLKQYEQEAWRQAFHDNLTGLPNRQLFTDRLNAMLAHSSRNSKMLALMFVDMDKFKRINDNHGHDKGDKVLIKFARRLGECLREEDTVARLGGDEFVILLPQINIEEDAAVVAKRILELFSEPWIIDGCSFTISASIGIAIYPLDGDSGELLMKKADTAMYQAKEEKLGYKFAH